MASNATRYGVPRELLQGRAPTADMVSASAIPRIEYSTGTARALQQFSQNLFSISMQLEDRLDDQARAEGAVSGAAAGAAGQTELRDYSTIRGRSYNQAMISTFVTTMDTNTITKIAALQQQFGSDPDRLEQEIRNYTEGAARQIDKIDPAAGAGFRQRALLRSMPAVEAARDSVFKMTRDQADAAIIQNEIAQQAEIKAYASDLFSPNPSRARAAASALQVVQADMMAVYNAVDPASGKPLFTAEERAKAQQKVQAQIMETAALSWFDQQPNKADAYLKFTGGDFKIELNSSPPPVQIVDATGGKIRNLPVQEGVKDKMSVAAAATDPRMSIKIVSGGQPTAGLAALTGARRTGSTRHDEGNSADIVLQMNGRDILPGEDPALYARFLENAAAAGFTGLGHYAWGIHVGGGKRAAWGPNTKSNTLDPVFGAAIERGWQGEPLQATRETQSVDLRDVLPSATLESLESEMRSRIRFSNELSDRADRISDEELKARQELTGYEFLNRLYNGGQKDVRTGATLQPLGRDEVTEAVRSGDITPAQGEAIIKAIATEKPMQSDPGVYRDALARLYRGEDIYNFVLQNSSRLSTGDASELLGKNQTLNVSGEGSMSKEEQFHFDNLQDLLTPDSLMSKIDTGAEQRKYSALDEYRQRVQEGENPRQVAADIAERATLDFANATNTALDKLVRPRFAVGVDGKPGRVDVKATAKALDEAAKAGKITEQSFRRQIELLRRWSDLQKRVDGG